MANSTNYTNEQMNLNFLVGPVFTHTENTVIMLFMMLFSVLGLAGNGKLIKLYSYHHGMNIMSIES